MAEIPQKFLQYLTGYGPRIIDSYCAETIGWGHRVIRRMSKEDFDELRNYGDMVYLNGDLACLNGWFLITKWLTVNEAIQKYGPITHETLSSRGGFITFGKTRFLSKRMDPKNVSKEKY